MFPHVTFLTLTLYDWFSLLGVLSALVTFRIYADKKGVSAKVLNSCLLFFVLSIVVGYFFAVLFQAIYRFTATGHFALNGQTGMTFYGGFIGGAATFCALYFTLGKKLCGKEAVLSEWQGVFYSAACAVALGHAFGRMGCFFAGCCYGRKTQSFLGIYFPSLGRKVLPTQLFEAGFLFLLFGVLSVLLFRTKVNTLSVYAIAYGVFRFIIEFFRADDRGASFIPWLSPSQCWAIFLVLAGLALLLFPVVRKKRK